MSRQEGLIKNDENTEAVDGPGAQTSGKAGLGSSSRKPANSGPDANEEHLAPVDGAFGKEECRDGDERGHYAPSYRAIHKRYQ